MSIRKTAAAALVATSLFTIPAFAKRNRDRCENKIRKAEANLNTAIRRHGERSRQAEQRREQLERVRATCHR